MKRAKRFKKKGNKNVIVLILIIVFCVSAIYLSKYFYSFYENVEVYNDIEKVTKSELSQKVEELQKENADIKAWINIENSNINYPLLQTKDNEYYLKHNYKKEESKYGSIFLNSNSNIKDNNSNVIIYGHNLKDNQMFNSLLNYADKSFFYEHPIITIATEETEKEYQIICVFKSRVFYTNEQDVFKYYQHYYFENESQYNEYINNCKTIQLYDIGITANYGEQLITLTTCEYSQENGRMVVVAKQIKE